MFVYIPRLMREMRVGQGLAIALEWIDVLESISSAARVAVLGKYNSPYDKPRVLYIN